MSKFDRYLSFLQSIFSENLSFSTREERRSTKPSAHRGVQREADRDDATHSDLSAGLLPLYPRSGFWSDDLICLKFKNSCRVRIHFENFEFRSTRKGNEKSGQDVHPEGYDINCCLVKPFFILNYIPWNIVFHSRKVYPGHSAICQITKRIKKELICSICANRRVKDQINSLCRFKIIDYVFSNFELVSVCRHITATFWKYDSKTETLKGLRDWCAYVGTI